MDKAQLVSLQPVTSSVQPPFGDGVHHGCMSQGHTETRLLEAAGSEERLAKVRRKFRVAARKAHPSLRARGGFREFGRSLLVLYWLGCIGVIAAGVNRGYPDLWPKVQRVLPGPDVAEPFPSCRAAHAAGVYDIPIWSPAYVSTQDGDGDGKACEPVRGYSDP